MKTKKLLILASAALVGGALLAPAGATSALAADEGYAFNEDTDLYLDNLVGTDDRRTFSETGATHQSFAYLDVDLATNVVDSEETCNDSLYKIGTASDHANGTVTLSIYVSEEVDLSKVKIKAHGGSTTPDVPSEIGHALNETVSEDGTINESIPRGEWTDVSISIPMTFAGENFVQGSTSVPVSNGVAGFHLYNMEGNQGTLRIREVRIGQTIDDFVTRPGDGVYWFGTQGNIVDASVSLENGSYVFDYGTAIEYSNIGLELLGDLSGLSIAPVSGGTVGTYVEYVDLLDHAGNPLPALLEERSTVTVDLEASGIATPFEGIAVASTTPVTVYGLFASDCEVRAPEILYPTLDLSSVSYFNDFNVTYEGGHWPTGYGPSGSDILVEHALDYAVAYTDDAQTAYLNGSSLVLPGIDDPAGFGNFFLGTNRHPDVLENDYMVVAARSLDEEGNPGTDFSAFRIVPDTANTLWANAGYAGYGLSTLVESGNYPYKDENGFVYLIFDIDECGLDRAVLGQGITFYWGSSTIEIDSIFFAKEAAEEAAESVALFEGKAATAPAEVGYQYLFGADLPTDPLSYGDALTLTIVNNGEAAENALASLRVEISGVGTYWFGENAEGSFRTKDGAVLPTDLAAGENVYEISLAASGIEDPSILAGKAMHFHYGNGQGPALDLTVSARVTPDHKLYETSWNGGEALALNPMTAADYNYLGGLNTGDVAFVGDVLEFTITNQGEETLTGVLETVRLGISNRTLWFVDNSEGQLLDLAGNPFSTDLQPGANTYRIRLSDFGIDPYSLAVDGVLHVHAGAGDAEGLTLSAKFIREGAPESDMAGLQADDYAAPSIELAAERDDYVAGDTVALSVAVSDDTDPNPTYEVAVSYGSGDTAEDVAVDGDSFLASKAGVYTITVTATDASGNVATKTLQVMVNEASASEPSTSEPGSSLPSGNESTPTDPSTPSDNPGLTDGQIWGIVGGVIGGLVVIGVAAALIVYFRNKKAK